LDIRINRSLLFLACVNGDLDSQLLLLLPSFLGGFFLGFFGYIGLASWAWLSALDIGDETSARTSAARSTGT